nr:MAG: membrane-bound lytic murein transglycosylase B [Candidatus Kentron sp. TUN]VFK56014.1 MAG: membrane-bound lytic murein transglycosylase B [Candidatus Kentron sp. TUN]
MPRLSIVTTILFAVIALLLSSALRADNPSELLKNTEVRRFIHQMVTQHDYSQEHLMALMERVRIVPALLKPSVPKEALPWYRYRTIFVTGHRAKAGVRFWQTYRDTLARAERIHGVPSEIIVAILGVESYFGNHKGKYPVLNSLVTLAFHAPKRRKFFLRELEQFLLLIREEKGFDVHGLKGSYAGAMGLPQFISSSYRRYAVDFDGDNSRDLIGNIADSIGSVANFLAEHGWNKDGGIVIPAKLTDDARVNVLVKRGIKPHIAFSTLKNYGVVIADSEIPPDERVSLIKLSAKTGPMYWVGRSNFYTITRYNHSKLYAMAVYQLAEAIRKRYTRGKNS